MLNKLIYITLFLVLSITKSYANSTSFTLKNDKQGTRLEISLPKGYSIYWIYPGEMGSPTKIDFSNSQNLKNYKIIWPFPKQKTGFAQIKTYYYDGKVSIPLRLIAINASSPVKVRANLEYVLCTDQCFLVNQTIDQELPGDLEKPLAPKLNILNVNYEAGNLSFIAKFSENVKDPEFLINPKLYNFVKSTTIVPKDRTTYKVTMVIDDKALTKNKITQYDIYSSKAPLPALISITNYVVTNLTSFLLICLFAIIGGFILNFMPCVLPVLSLKIFSFVKNPEADKRLSCLLTIAGIITTFWSFALITILLKNSSRQFGFDTVSTVK